MVQNPRLHLKRVIWHIFPELDFRANGPSYASLEQRPRSPAMVMIEG